MRTPRGVLLHWDPPEMVPQRLDGYILEGRQGSQSWEVLDGAVAGAEVQLLVPGLIKVSVGSRHRGFCGSPGPSSIPRTQIGPSSRLPTLPSPSIALSFQTGLVWEVRPDPDLLELLTSRMFSTSFALWPWPVAMSAVPATQPMSPLLVRTWREGRGWGLGALSPLNLDTGPPSWLLAQAWRSTRPAPSCQASCHSPCWLACWVGSASWGWPSL